ncbi:MAG TPA: cyclic nucleotide-binding protein [Opitutae bacterium]|nr:cyclic nucleotide-binding protein [Opitutae bacterium]
MKLSEHPFIESIGDNERRTEILREVELKQLNDQDPIFEEQSIPDALYLILEGSVAFTKERPDASKQTVNVSHEGSFFGEVGVFTGEPRALGARADGAAVLGRIPKATVSKIVNDAEPVRLILESVVHHLNSTTDHYMNEVMSTEKLTLVGTMMSSILHDFNNPFSIISLAATLLEQRYSDDPKAVSFCKNIHSQISRMTQMANDLAAFSRGDREIKVARVSLDILFKHFQELNAPFFKDRTVELTMHANGAELQGDADKLLRVLQNLINNSKEAIRASESHGTIQVIANDIGDSILLSVRDNGPGIHEAIRANFFEPFVTHGKKGGTGLGTAIIKSIVEAHQGSIDFETNADGTCFNIMLPKNLSIND